MLCSVIKGESMKSILDPSFRYVPSAATDLAATFRRVRREQKAGEQARRDAIQKITPIRQKGTTP